MDEIRVNFDVDEFLRFSFKAVADDKYLEPRLGWPDDLEGQTHVIQQLVTLATWAAIPYRLRALLYKELYKRAGYYYRKGAIDVPVEMIRWSLGVASGQLRLKRPRGRDSSTNSQRDRMIVKLVAWLREAGETRESAIEKVARAVEQVKKAGNPKATFGPDAVKTILRKKKN